MGYKWDASAERNGRLLTGWYPLLGPWQLGYVCMKGINACERRVQDIQHTWIVAG